MKGYAHPPPPAPRPRDLGPPINMACIFGGTVFSRGWDEDEMARLHRAAHYQRSEAAAARNIMPDFIENNIRSRIADGMASAGRKAEGEKIANLMAGVKP